jgi:competence protein ComEC
LTASDARRAAVGHVVGSLALRRVGDWRDGHPLSRASNRVRALVARGAAHLPAADRPLFAGLIIGDDRDTAPATIGAFRAAGLSHLTAVSGSNVAFVLAAAGPMLRRLRPWPRWAATIALVGWFVALTRFEPSILRAGAMAAIAATGHVLGREHSARRTLLLAVAALVAIDPLLVWSVGFWLSVAATGGIAVLAPVVTAALPGPVWLRAPLGVTIGAQLAVAPVSLLVFGALPLVSLPANLLAVPVAGFVMLYGLPASIAAGLCGGVVGDLVQVPSLVATRWVAWVAVAAARCEPPAPWPLAGWVLVVVGVAWRAARARGAFGPGSVAHPCAKVGADGGPLDHR